MSAALGARPPSPALGVSYWSRQVRGRRGEALQPGRVQVRAHSEIDAHVVRSQAGNWFGGTILTAVQAGAGDTQPPPPPGFP